MAAELLFIGFVLSWSIFSLLVVLGICLFPWGEFADEKGIINFKIEEGTASTDPMTYFHPPRDTSRVLVRFFRALRVTWRELKTWKLFYFSFFLLFPLIVGVITGIEVEAENEDLLFLEISNNTSGEVAAQTAVWLSVYFFSAMAICSIFSSLQTTASVKRADWMFKKLPLQYADRIYIQFGIIGSLVLFIGALILLNERGKKGADEDEGVDFILRAATIAPWVNAIKICFRGFSGIFDMCFVGVLPGMKSLWFLSHYVAIFGTLAYIGLTNDLALYISFGCWAALWFLPSTYWLLSFTRITILPGHDERRRFKRNFNTNRGKSSGDSSVGTVQVPVVTNKGQPGGKHWIWSPWHPMDLPMSGYFVRGATEEDRFANLVITMSQHTLGIDALGINEIENDKSLKSVAAFCCPVYLCTLPWHHCLNKKGNLMKNLSNPNKHLNLWMSPPTGRNAASVLEQFSKGDYSSFIFATDSAGISKSLVFFAKLLHLKKKDDELDLLLNGTTFIWQCETMFDLVRLFEGLLLSCENTDVWTNLPKMVILYRGGIAPFAVRKALSSAFQKEGDTNKNELFNRTLLGSLVCHFCLHIEALDFEKKFDLTDQSTVLFSTIGTAGTCYLLRDVARGVSTQVQSLKFVDFVVEDSVYNQPTQARDETLGE